VSTFDAVGAGPVSSRLGRPVAKRRDEMKYCLGTPL
jgi:hypothetical protein